MTELIKCTLCSEDDDAVEVTKQRCGHIICWKCLGKYVPKKLAVKIKCPIEGCDRTLSDGAVRKVLSDDDITKYEQLMLGKVSQSIKCLLQGCNFIFVCFDPDIRFDCGNCTLFNCVRCKAAHKSLTCSQYRTSDEASAICQREMIRATQKLQVRGKEKCRAMFVEMEETDLFLLDNLLECPNCDRHLGRGDGVVLRCSHIFCRFCLNNHIANTMSIPISCMTKGCVAPLFEREIKQLLNETELALYIDRCNSSVKGKLDLSFQCQKPDCPYFVTYSMIPKEVRCTVCSSVNCTKCLAIHNNETCEQFKERIRTTPYGKSLLDIEERIRRKELMRCLKCNQLLQKISGCSWIQCSNCKFEMCWALQMRRWGPKGRGDESDGCKCRLLGPRCAPDCESCEPHHEEGEQIELGPEQIEFLHFLATQPLFQMLFGQTGR